MSFLDDVKKANEINSELIRFSGSAFKYVIEESKSLDELFVEYLKSLKKKNSKIVYPSNKVVSLYKKCSKDLCNIGRQLIRFKYYHEFIGPENITAYIKHRDQLISEFNINNADNSKVEIKIDSEQGKWKILDKTCDFKTMDAYF